MNERSGTTSEDDDEGGGGGTKTGGGGGGEDECVVPVNVPAQQAARLTEYDGGLQQHRQRGSLCLEQPPWWTNGPWGRVTL